LLAGRDTTACMLTWTMRLLVSHEKVMAKLQDEIGSVVGVGEDARHPDRTDMKKMLYLSYVLKEGRFPSLPRPSCCIHSALLMLMRCKQFFGSTLPCR